MSASPKARRHRDKLGTRRRGSSSQHLNHLRSPSCCAVPRPAGASGAFCCSLQPRRHRTSGARFAAEPGPQATARAPCKAQPALQQTLPVPKRRRCTGRRVTQPPCARPSSSECKNAFKQTAPTQQANKDSFDGSTVKVRASEKRFE